jgi:glycosyltransferase involved in cell wall biosynthesis
MELKILHINSNYLYTTLHQNLIECLNKQDINNIIFMPTSKGKEFVIPIKDYVHHPVSFKDRDRFIFYYKQNKILKSFHENISISESTYDLVHAHTLFTDGNVALELFNEYKIPYIVSVRNTDINSFFKKRIFLRGKGLEILKNSSKIIFLSKSYQKLLINKYIPSYLQEEIRKKSIIIPNGIDNFWLQNKFLTKEIKKEKELNLIFAGRINKNKNITMVLNACKILINMGFKIKFTVVGKSENEQELKRITQYPFVNYMPKKDMEELLLLYRENDIFVMPSITETFGLVYGEAMSQGLPVIYTKNQGFDGQFEEGMVGYHVNCNNARDIANKIIEVMNNYQIISSNCIQLCDKFDWNTIGQEYKKLYKSI